MAEEPREETPESKTSAELIAEARNAFGADSPSGVEASEDLMEQAREWIADSAVTEAEPMTLPAVILEPEIDEEIGRLFEAPPSRPVGRRPRTAPRPIPIPAPDGDRPTRQRRRILGLAATIGVVALLSNVTALLVNSDSDDTNVVEPAVTVSEGSISTASDPCSDATISGDLVAVITYWDDPDIPSVEVSITGDALVGSDGSTYDLTIFGATSGEPGQTEFIFVSEYMDMTRNDGLLISDSATLTIEVVGRDATNWSYTSEGSDCGT